MKNKKIVTIVGARPQFIKCSVMSREIASLPGITEVIVHTGQHYDDDMSRVFFEQLQIPLPHYSLGISGMSHGAMTGAMIAQIEEVLLTEKPDAVMVYGDTNSTLAGALAASKLHVPVIHVEAGLRSFNKKMPEEINRVLTDHMSDLLFCPTPTAAKNLCAEGIARGVHLSGDVMCDAAIFAKSAAKTTRNDFSKDAPYVLCTLHRAENTDDKIRLATLFDFVNSFSDQYKIVFPLHPRTEKKAREFNLRLPAAHVVEPLSYFELHAVLADATFVLTDSGGLQKEAYFHHKPCITLRDETEWLETVDAGWNVLLHNFKQEFLDERAKRQPITCYGDGHAGAAHMAQIQTFFQSL